MKQSAVFSCMVFIALLGMMRGTNAQCPSTCDGATPICDASTLTCVPCTTQAQCWAASSNELSCDLNSGECKFCNSSSTCPEAAPICSSVTSTCTTCNATAECSLRLSGSICYADSGVCGWCSDDADCVAYGEGSTCTNVTSVVRKCSIPTIGPITVPGLPDPNNINGVITAYVIICIVLLMLFIMFVVCACNKDEDYAPVNAPHHTQNGSAKKSPANGTANGKHANGTQEIELDSKPPNGKSK